MGALEDLPQLIPHHMAAELIPGAAAGLIVDGQLRLLSGFGTTRADDDGRSVTPDTAFAIGSITKPLVATALFALAEDGLLDLDEALEPGCVTLRTLLSHSSRLRLRDESDTELVDPVRQFRVDDEARSPAYSNAAFALAAFFAERRAGVSLDALIAERVCGPLGMRNTSFVRPSDVASGHVLVDGAVRPQGLVPDAPLYRAARGAYSTARDLIEFARAHLSGAFDAMHVTIAERRSRASSIGFGLGFETHEYKGVHLVGHAGHLGQFWSQLMMVPTEGVAFVLLCSRPPKHRLTSAAYRVIEVVLGLEEGPVNLGCPRCGAELFDATSSCSICTL